MFYSVLRTKSCASVCEPPSFLWPLLSSSPTSPSPSPRIVEPRHAIFPASRPCRGNRGGTEFPVAQEAARANIAIKLAPCKNLAVSPYPPRDPGGSTPSGAFSSSLRSLRSTAKRICTLDRPRLRDRAGGERERERRREQVRSFRDGKTRSGEITRRRWSRHAAGRGGKRGWGGGTGEGE